MYKPMKFIEYLRWIKQYGWSLHKGKIDWNLVDQNGNYVCSIKLQHPGPKEIVARSVKKTNTELKKRELL